MYALCLQDWTTLRGATSVATLTQPEPGWLDLTPFQDVVTWLEVKELTPAAINIPTLAYQTSPTKDEALFFNMAPPVVAALGVTTTVMLKDAMPAGFPPCAKWFRWQLIVSGAVAWDLTFRIWIAANLIGNRVAISPATTLAELEKEGYRYGYGEEPPTVTSVPSQVTVPQGGGNGDIAGGGGYSESGQGTGGPSKWHLPSIPVPMPLHSGSNVQVNNPGHK